MAVEILVMLCDDRLPTCQEWQRAIDAAAIDIKLEQIDDLRSHSGFLPAQIDGNDSGFEWYYGTIADVLDEGFEGPSEYDHAAGFVIHGDLQELACALLAAGCLANAADGVFFDEEAGAFVSGDRAIEIARGIDKSERDRRYRLAAKDARITDQRCPSCGAPCPSYRKTCKVCGVEVRRSI